MKSLTELNCSPTALSNLHPRALLFLCADFPVALQGFLRILWAPLVETEERGQIGQERVTCPQLAPPPLPSHFPSPLFPGTHVETVCDDLGEKLAEQKLRAQLLSFSPVCTGSLSPSV